MKHGILLFVVCFGFAGCLDFKEIKAPANGQAQFEEPDPNLRASQIGFAEVQRYVLLPSCVRCHGGSRPAGDMNLSSYASTLADAAVVNPGSPLGSSLYTEIATGGMPENGAPLSEARANLIYNWIKAGAPERPSEVPAPEPSPVVTPVPTPTPVITPGTPAVYSVIRDAVIVPSCIKCHNPAKPAGNVDLSSYELVLANPKVVNPGDPEASSFYTEIATGKMPKRKPRLDDVLTNLIYEWIKAGAPKE